MKIDNYIKKEEITIKKFIESQPQITLNEIMNEGYSKFDFIFTSASTTSSLYAKGLCEAKTRDITSTKFAGGVIMELTKFTSLMTHLSDYKDNYPYEMWKAFYLMKYKDVTYLFDLEQVDLGSVIFKSAPKTTFNSGGYIQKPFILLNKSQAILTINHT